MIKAEIGQHIRELRNAKGYSQESFAKVCGLDRTYIASVEQGKRNISLENLKKIADAFEITLSDLCAVNIPMHRTIVLKVNGEVFLLQSKEELTQDIMDEIEIICRYALDEEEPALVEDPEQGSVADLLEIGTFEIAELFQKAVLAKLGVHVSFQRIDLEVSING